jgi:ABC-2 type transport system permease protein
MTALQGSRVLLAKEQRESWRTRRTPVVVVLFVLLGMLAPLTARYLPEILELALGDQAGAIPIPPTTVADAVLELQQNIGQFGALTAIVLAMTLVSGEKDRGTAGFILTKPASRAAFLVAKLASLGVVLFVATALAVAVAWIYTAILFEPLPIGGWAALALFAWLSLMVWASITFLASTVLRSSAAAAGVGVGALLGISLVAAIPPVGRWLPSGLDPQAALLALGRPIDPADLAAALTGTVVIIVGSVILAWLSFRRQEL